MRLKDNELAKVNNSEIKRLEKTLTKIDKEETRLLADFDKNIATILGPDFLSILEEVNKLTSTVNGKKTLFVDRVPSSRSVETKTNRYKVPDNFLQLVHKSYLPVQLKLKYEKALKTWFSKKTEELRKKIKNVDSYEEIERIMPEAYALASLALTAFHTRPRMILRDVQKLTGIAISEGSIAELGTGEGKTLSAVLPVYLQALRGKGAHVITANPYLARRDFEETLPIFEGLGLSSGYLPENEEELAQSEGKDPKTLTPLDRAELYKKLTKIKQESYRRDITYGSKATFAFDYLRDNGIRKKEDMMQRLGRPGFALIDEVDDALVDDAQVPYRIAQLTPTYEPGLTLKKLCTMFNVSVKTIEDQVKNVGLSTGILSYEEASYIAKAFLNGELLPDQSRYQELAQLYFESQRLLVTEDQMYGFKTGKDLFNAIMDEKNYNSDGIKRKYDIIYCREKKEYIISDRCYEGFLKFCYLSLHMNSDCLTYQKQILDDPKYVRGVDYTLINGRISLTNQGAGKIIYDKNYPRIMDNYQKYMSTVSQESATMVHYLQQAVTANLIMVKDQDYTVDGGKVKTMKNGRIQEGSTYSDGLHQAIEIRERIPRQNRSRETIASSSITQKDFYQRYDMFSGMTGTSAKELFNEVYGKTTVEIPKHAFYSFFGRRRVKGAKEPIGVEKKDATFALTLEDKINLIVKSVIESRNAKPPQPILLVVSDVEEIGYLETALKLHGIGFNTLTATTDKETEAEIVAIAGRPGAVTISTEMAGRGTDIKIGGDRETIIDIKTNKYIRQLEKQYGHLELTSEEKIQLRKKVETALLNANKIWSKKEEQVSASVLEHSGLKVISSGYFRMSRVDRQLEGRTGRNGISGVCERFVYPEDLKRIGIGSIDGKNSISSFLQKFKKNPDGSLQVDRRGYETITEKVKTMQQVFEDSIKTSIRDTQKLDSHATKLVEEYRESRRKIICDETNVEEEAVKLIENSLDAIISSYITDDRFTKKDLLVPLNNNKIGINLEAISLEVKKSLGVSFDPKMLLTSDINLLEFRNAVINSAKERLAKADKEKIKQALLDKYDYMIKNIPYLLDHSFAVKRLTAMSMGMEGQADYSAQIEFYTQRQRMILDASKLGAKQLLGLPLTLEQDKKLEKIREDIFGLKVSKSKGKQEEYEVVESKREENNLGAIQRLREIKAKLEMKQKPKLDRVNSKIDRLEKNGKNISLNHLYRGLSVRPMKFINAMVEGRQVSRLVLIRERKVKKDDGEKKL